MPVDDKDGQGESGEHYMRPSHSRSVAADGGDCLGGRVNEAIHVWYWGRTSAISQVSPMEIGLLFRVQCTYKPGRETPAVVSGGLFRTRWVVEAEKAKQQKNCGLGVGGEDTHMPYL